ncbi:hypothetical protein TUM19329_03150 [Legionella antarctica]|uniref:DUF5621 domain-containing protein n=1 Tax=Legionella antarctica TaxID=2708020 RepID=A0A6F8SZU6_9GAMM|nr:DUF5621 domain-containing protein [Legionella antarctica]BCA93954.1 hypothetical protein TUM19329_03150 [Legionella antarctica]
MANFTLFAYGTGETHTTIHNIISQFSNACVSEKTILDGPNMLGLEVQANAEQGTKRILEWLKAQTDDKNSINLTGFSRGSVTCIRIANLLQSKKNDLEKQKSQNQGNLGAEDENLLKRLNQLDLNLFLMDPVAGLTDKSAKESRIIPEMVSSYVAVLQKDERRPDFKPQDMTRIVVANPQKTKMTMLPLYGNHSDTTKIKDTGMESGPKLVWYTLHQFLTQKGTQFAEDKIPPIAFSEKHSDKKKQIKPIEDLTPEKPDAKELLKLFAEHHQNRKAYLKSGTAAKLFDGIPAPRTERTLNQHGRYYVKNSAFFINQLERELFKIAYPKSFNYLFEKNLKDPRFPDDSENSKELVRTELEQIEKNNPGLFKRLRHYGVENSSQGITLGGPRGYNYLEPCMSMQQLLPDLVPALVKEHAEQMNKLPLLEQEVYRVTFQYEREKGELSFSEDRSKAERAQQIRKEVNNLINNGTESTDQKYERVLDKLEQHFKELILSNSSSDLIHMVGKILAKHDRNYAVKQSLTNELMVTLVYSTLSLAKEAVRFAGNLGYVGGYSLYAVGAAVEAIGVRANELIGDIGYNPLKLVGAMCATLLEGVGFLIKHSFGLRPLTQFLTNGIKGIRDSLTQAINTTTIEKINPELIKTLESEVEEASIPILPHGEGSKTTFAEFKQAVTELRSDTKEDTKSELSDNHDFQPLPNPP